MNPAIHYLVTNVRSELNEVVFDSYVSGATDVLPSAAYMADFRDQLVVQVVQKTAPPVPVLSMSPYTVGFYPNKTQA